MKWGDETKWHVETDAEGWQKILDARGNRVTDEWAHISETNLTPIVEAHNVAIDKEHELTTDEEWGISRERPEATKQ